MDLKGCCRFIGGFSRSRFFWNRVLFRIPLEDLADFFSLGFLEGLLAKVPLRPFFLQRFA